MKMDYKKEYKRYLASPEWKELRSKARDRAGNKCEFCGGPPDHVHHVKYPKRYKDDHLDNLVVACEPCHEKLHGIRDDIYFGDWVGVASGIMFDGAVPRIKINFTVVPKEHQDVQTFKDLVKLNGEQNAVEIRDQFDGFFPNESDNFSAHVSLKNVLFESKNTSAEEMLMSILESRDYHDIGAENLQEVGELFLKHFNLGPVTVAFKKS